MKYPNDLQLFRKRAKLTQHELAQRLGPGLNRVIISNWETGVSLAPKDMRKKIGDILKVSQKRLFKTEGKK